MAYNSSSRTNDFSCSLAIGNVNIESANGTLTIEYQDDMITITQAWRGRVFVFTFTIDKKNDDVVLLGGPVTYSGTKGSGTAGTVSAVRADYYFGK